MRRVLAVTLFVVIAFPAWAAGVAWACSLPLLPLRACCLRDGKHHCMMAAHLKAQDTGPAFSSNVCPYRTGARTHTSTSVSYSTPSSVYFAGLLSHSAVPAQTQAKYRISAVHANLKRGPPIRSL